MTEIGKIVYAKELGFNDYSKRMWSACKLCSKERWATFEGGKVKEYCQSCSQKVNNKHKTKRGNYTHIKRSKSVCKTCKVEYPATNEYFPNSKATKNGLSLGRCKKCIHKIAGKRDRATIQGRLNRLVSNNIRVSLHGLKDNNHWEDLVGYTLKDLMKHLECKFKLGMTWENYGKWHIDHIIPKSVFQFNSPDDIDFKRCWALKNLQPLWHWENESKGAKVKDGFQPSLK
jgi:hypothetical protein